MKKEEIIKIWHSMDVDEAASAIYDLHEQEMKALKTVRGKPKKAKSDIEGAIQILFRKGYGVIAPDGEMVTEFNIKERLKEIKEPGEE